MKTFMLKLFCFMLIVSTMLFISTACKNEEDSNNDNDNAVSQGLEFERSSDYTGYAVAGIGDCFDTKIIIPSTYNDKPVVEIKEEAFKGYYLTSITIPESVITIGEEAFSSCYKLVEVVNKSPYITVTKGSDSNGCLGYYALSVSNCDDSYISKVSTDSNGFVIYTNGNDKILVNYIGTNTNITIPSDITEINENAFRNCFNLTSVTIGNSVTSIGNSAFESCSNLTSITIPNSVTSIGEWAFSYCSNLTSVTIPNSVTSIDWYAFYRCDNLTSVTIGNSVTNIGYQAFYYCDNLTKITYNGTKSKWNSIKKGYYWNYFVPATYVTCTDGTVSIEN